MELTSRQEREREYHRKHAESHSMRAARPVALDVVRSDRRRWWNAYWETYRLIRRESVEGKRILVPGSGFGEDVVRLAAVGAEAYGFDLSPELVTLATRRAERTGFAVKLDVMTAEKLSYPSNSFDGVVLIDILHHVDIPAAMKEIQRVLKPGAFIIGNELYTHTALQRIREGRLVSGVLYSRMVRFIYGTDTPYITEDEHKIDEREFAVVRSHMTDDIELQHFNFLDGRIVPSGLPLFSQFDRAVLMALRPMAAVLAGRVVFRGTVAK
jgi:ubiquinone/menaquinone biosynthesis C-methylase UbiE